MERGERVNVLMALAAVAMLALVLTFLGMIWFGKYTDAMNETFVDPVYYTTILIGMGIVGFGLLASLAYDQKKYFGARVIGTLVALGGMFLLYLWWYKVMPFLY